MIRAAARGVIDFRDADPRNIQWLRRSRMLRRAMEADDELTIVRTALAYQLALLSNGNLEKKSFEDAKGRVKVGFEDVVAILQPWTRKADRKDEIENLVDLYKRVKGDPNDPAYMARIEEDIRQHQERRKAEKALNPQGSEDAIDQRIRERDERRKRGG